MNLKAKEILKHISKLYVNKTTLENLVSSIGVQRPVNYVPGGLHYK